MQEPRQEHHKDVGERKDVTLSSVRWRKTKITYSIGKAPGRPTGQAVETQQLKQEGGKVSAWNGGPRHTNTNASCASRAVTTPAPTQGPADSPCDLPQADSSGGKSMSMGRAPPGPGSRSAHMVWEAPRESPLTLGTQRCSSRAPIFSAYVEVRKFGL